MLSFTLHAALLALVAMSFHPSGTGLGPPQNLIPVTVVSAASLPQSALQPVAATAFAEQSPLQQINPATQADDGGAVALLLQTQTGFSATHTVPETPSPVAAKEPTASAPPPVVLASAQYHPALFASSAAPQPGAASAVIVLPPGKRRSHGITIAITSPTGRVAEFYAELADEAEGGTTVSVLQ